MSNSPFASGGQHPTIGDSFVTEHQAIQILESFLRPGGWLWRKQAPDYFVDYHVEAIERGEPTGLQFALQVKGTANAKRRGNSLQYPMTRKRLAYYRDSARLPVFVALVDTTKKTAHWLFAQRYLRESASRADLSNQNSLTLRFDPADSFSNLERFREALRQAEKYVRDLYPSSLEAAISEREKELQALDPDIGVKLEFRDGHEIWKLTPTKPLSLGFRTLKPEGCRSFQAMLDHGEVFKSEVEIVLPSSPLFQKLMPPLGKGVAYFTPDPREGCLQIVSDAASPIITQINGQWHGGAKSVSFTGSLPKSPLSIALKIDDVFGEPKTSFDTPLRLTEWENQPLLRLPWFDEIHSFIMALATGQEFRANCLMEGSNVGGFVATATQSKSVQRLRNTIDWLAKCRFVAKHYRVDVNLPRLKEITYAQERDVEALSALATGNSVEDSISEMSFGFSAAPDLKLPERWQSFSEPITETMKLLGVGTFDFLGHTIEVPNIENLFTDMELVNIEANATSNSLLFKGRSSSVWTRRKMK